MLPEAACMIGWCCWTRSGEKNTGRSSEPSRCVLLPPRLMLPLRARECLPNSMNCADCMLCLTDSAFAERTEPVPLHTLFVVGIGYRIFCPDSRSGFMLNCLATGRSGLRLERFLPEPMSGRLMRSGNWAWSQPSDYRMPKLLTLSYDLNWWWFSDAAAAVL